jgi:hypothetical protein
MIRCVIILVYYRIIIQLLQNFTPGPGQYQTIQGLDKQLEKTSDSKRGTGSFASKVSNPSFSLSICFY